MTDKYVGVGTYIQVLMAFGQSWENPDRIIYKYKDFYLYKSTFSNRSNVKYTFYCSGSDLDWTVNYALFINHLEQKNIDMKEFITLGTTLMMELYE